MSGRGLRLRFNRSFHQGAKRTFRITGRRTAAVLMTVAFTLALVLALAATASAGGKGPIVHRVHVGVPDACAAFGLQPGCDANWSLVAIQYADGSVTGQFIDRFAGGFGGFHAVIDCLYVDGNDAWVSGWITQGSSGDMDLAGEPVSARVRDSGTSANDPPDQISFSHIGADGGDHPHGTCEDYEELEPYYELFDVPQGQVVVQ